MPRLLATDGPLKGRAFPIGERCTLGRDPASTVVLGEATASRRHAEIRPEKVGRMDGDAWRAADLGSHNGTYVNGKKVKEAPIRHGDSITVGDHTFLFLEDEAQAPTVASEEPRRFQLGSAVEDFEMVGEAGAFKACLARAERLARADAPVLLTGETGTGKELLARWIHRQSQRARGPFVAVNCAAIPESLFEAELFGAEAGAFTGAQDRRPGKFELASGGTLFLDEIGELPLDLQPKLLRAVQEKAFFRVGGTKEIRTDVRIVAATNRDLEAAARAGTFREDLFHRLGTLPLSLPPLRERKEDIPLLARHAAERTSRRLGKPFAGFTAAALARLAAYAWPGNVRELRNLVERAVILSEKGPLDAGAFDLRSVGQPATDAGDLSLASAEREAIRRALAKTGGKKGEAAKALGISWPTLRRKMKEHHL